jgi:PAS domain S-box-containing protein
MIGYEHHELLNMTPLDIKPSFTPESFRAMVEPLTTDFDNSHTFETIHKHKNGNNIPVEITLQYVATKLGKPRFVVIVRDITERRRIETEKLEWGRKYQELFDTMFNGFALHEIIVDDVGSPINYRFLEINKKFEEMTGLKASEVVGKTVSEVLPDIELEWILNYGKVALTGSTYRFENYSQELDKHFEVVAYCNKPMQFVTVFQDISAIKRNEALLLDAKEKAEAANQAKSEFLAVMSHEIRTPLNAILGMTEIALESNSDPDLSSYLQIIERSGNNLLSLISDILDLSHIEAGRLVLDNKPIYLNELTRDALDIHRHNADSKGVALLCHIDPTTPGQFLGDQKRLRQVLLNLLGNAVKFTKHGKIEILVACPNPKTIQFSVLDSGIGIPLDKQKIIFKPFSQGDASNTRQYGGVGLGLAICKRLVDAMNGEIWVESEAGKGSTFHFSIPVFSKSSTS